MFFYISKADTHAWHNTVNYHIYTVNRFIFAALNFCDYGPFGLLRAFYFCARKMQNLLLSMAKVEF